VGQELRALAEGVEEQVLLHPIRISRWLLPEVVVEVKVHVVALIYLGLMRQLRLRELLAQVTLEPSKVLVVQMEVAEQLRTHFLLDREQAFFQMVPMGHKVLIQVELH
jgi:hypothetical protein